MVNESLAEGDVKFAANGIDRIKAAMVRLDDLIADVITVTKNRQVDFETETIELSKMVTEIVRSYAELPNYAQIEIIQQVAPDLTIQHREWERNAKSLFRTTVSEFQMPLDMEYLVCSSGFIRGSPLEAVSGCTLSNRTS